MSIRDLVNFKRKENSLNPVRSLQSEIDRVFNNFLSDFSFPNFSENFLSEQSYITPKINIVEKDKEIRIDADLPGINEKDLDISVKDNTLTIKGERKSEKEDKNENYHLKESSFGSFYRTIALPSDADVNKIEASFKNGVAKILIPKTQDSFNKAKKIEVKSS